MPLKYKLFTLFLFAALIPMSIMTIGTFQKTKSEISDRVYDQLSTIAETQDKRLESIVASYLDSSLLIANNPIITQILVRHAQSSLENTGSTVTLLEEMVSSTNTFRDIAVYGADGVLLSSSTNYTKPDEELDILAYEGIYDAYQDDRGGLSVRIIEEVSAQDGVVLGFVDLVINAHGVLDISRDYTGLGQTGELMIMRGSNKESARIFTPFRFPENVGQSLESGVQLAQIAYLQMQEETSGLIPYTHVIDYRGTKVLAVIHSIQGTTWGLIVKIDNSEAFAELDQIQKLYAVILLLSAICSGLFGALFSSTLTHPIKRLIEKVDEFREGKLNARVDNLGSSQEIVHLGESFNKMASEIQTLYRDMEKKIHERTAELEETYAQIEGMLDNIGEGILFMNMEGKVTMINKAACKMLGTTMKMAFGKDHMDVVKPRFLDGETVPRSQSATHQIITKGVQSSRREYYYARRDGTLVPVSVLSTLVTVDGEKRGVISVFRDTTNEKRIDQAKTELVSLLGHQLRAPLSSIKWYTEMLTSGEIGALNEDQQSYLETITDSNEHLIQIVSSLLDISRIEMGTFQLNLKKADLISLTKDVIAEEVSLSEKQHGHRIETNFALQEAMMDLDTDVYRIIMQNLVRNAIKYTPDGGLISIGISAPDEKLVKKDKRFPKNTIVVSIKDEGYGIPEDQKTHIFEKLFRASNAKKISTDGIGIGLYIANKITKCIGGKMWFDSKEGKGSTFYFSIPKSGMKKIHSYSEI